MKDIGAPLELWEELSMKSKKFKIMAARIDGSSSMPTNTLLVHEDFSRKKVISICTTRPSASNIH